MASDAAFVGSIPETYERCLVPALFEPYARDMVARVERFAPLAVLEVAAGSGALTRQLARQLPAAVRLVASDLNQAMLTIAEDWIEREGVELVAADAQALPFADSSFDVVACQFGVMFYPDRRAGHAEALRVLRPGGAYLFSVWNRLEDNPASQAVHRAAQEVMGEGKADFLARVPFACHDPHRLHGDLNAAGFHKVSIERVDFVQDPVSLAGLVQGMCEGSPLAAEIAAQPADRRAALRERAEAELRALIQAGPVCMSALVITARKD
ncbi:class I SAM-dependent methyltransferase [Novosphingobium sp. TH158]|uniref:class I SAM-dependent methyltransferase n=1 Tax=Novosphingobium sp. TH158 TaxID=2067455 RepID=UPI000C7AFE5D|nr:class I SAM-dependent methyltransferase [Novosphingobium sp. TH158]PLK27118.1 SAM-dependent methyltransferase [Novosphingobium sp. TH158]